MRRASFLTVAAATLALAAACGGGTPATPTPRTSNAPVTTPAPGPTTAASGPTVAPPTQAGSPPLTGSCTGGPVIDPSNLPADADLATRFPEQIDGQPVTGVETFRWTDFACASGGQAAIDAWKDKIPVRFHAIVDGLSYGSGDATVDGESVEITAFRAAGHDGSFLSVLYGELFQMVNGELPSGYSGSTSYVTLGGKEVTITTDDEGGVAYLYQSGDVLFSVIDVTESQAGKVFAAVP